MVTKATDISIVLSGGSTNAVPDKSIGGEPSATPIRNNMIDNLFGDIGSDQAASGGDDYRCFYVFNDGNTTIYEIRAWVLSKMPGDSSVMVGIKDFDEVQRITVSNIASGGYVTLSYENVSFNWIFDQSLTIWALNLQNGLNSLLDVNQQHLLRQVRVTGTALGDSLLFDIYFEGQDSSRSCDLITVVANHLTNAPLPVATRIQAGSPINSVAEMVSNANSAPVNVGFYLPTEQSAIVLPKLQPDEGSPIWVRRTYPAGTEALEGDGFYLRITAESLDPLAD